MSEVAPLERYLDPDAVKSDLKINLGDISESLANQTQLFVHYASLAVRAKRQFERWKAAVEVLEAQLDGEARRKCVEEGIKVTDSVVNAYVASHPQYKAAASMMINAKEIMGLCDVAERAFEHRREMVKQIAQDQAREWVGGERLMAQGGTAQERANAFVSRMGAASGGKTAT